MKRRNFIEYAGMWALGLSFPSLLFGKGKDASKPNIVLINVDDLGWTDAECFGSRYYETPNINKLAARGMKFTDAYAAAAVCSPTRASILTGRYPARVGITDWIHARFQLHEYGETLPPDNKFRGGYRGGKEKKLSCPINPFWMALEEITLAEILKPAGYTSCHIGKWHLGPDDWYPEKQGFDLNLGGCDFGQPPTYFDPYYSMKYGAGAIPTLKPRKKGEYLTDREADEACGFIKKHRDKPFFLHMAHYAVHTPIEGKKELVDKYKKKQSPTKQKSPTYAAMVESVDQAVGRILATLDALNLTRKTIVIFTSDNGGLKRDYCTDNAPLREGKGHPYEGGIRIPQIISWPEKVEEGRVCRTPVCSIDFVPTICQAVNLALPAGRIIDGKSLMPLLTGKGDFKRDALFWHFPHYRGKIMPYSIVRRGDWKLIRRYDGKPFELFNLKDDIGETTDLSAKRPDLVKKLNGKLSRWLKDTGAKIPKPGKPGAK